MKEVNEKVTLNELSDLSDTCVQQLLRCKKKKRNCQKFVYLLKFVHFESDLINLSHYLTFHHTKLKSKG